MLLGAAPLWAHEEGAAHADQILGQPPEYLHVLLHPALTVGLALAVVALAAGVMTRSKAAQVVALALVLGCSAAAWPVLGLGQNAYNRIRPQADEVGRREALTNKTLLPSRRRRIATDKNKNKDHENIDQNSCARRVDGRDHVTVRRLRRC